MLILRFPMTLAIRLTCSGHLSTISTVRHSVSTSRHRQLAHLPIHSVSRLLGNVYPHVLSPSHYLGSPCGIGYNRIIRHVVTNSSAHLLSALVLIH